MGRYFCKFARPRRGFLRRPGWNGGCVNYSSNRRGFNWGKETKSSREPNIDRVNQKEVWTDGYLTWNDAQFKSRVRITCATFEFLLTEIGPSITKPPTNWIPKPIETHRQLGLTLYRLAHGCSFQVLDDVFGVSRSLASETFNIVIWVLVAKVFDLVVVLPETEDEWKVELKAFIENYAFPCIGAWDGFHVHVATLLKIIIASNISIRSLTWV